MPRVWAEESSGMTLAEPRGHLQIRSPGVSGGQRRQPLEADCLGTDGGHGALNAKRSKQREFWEVKMY